jgi:hypothetical protein
LAPESKPSEKQGNDTLTKKKKFSSYIYKEIQSGAVAQSYMRKGFLTEEMRKYFPIYEEAVIVML